MPSALLRNLQAATAATTTGQTPPKADAGPEGVVFRVPVPVPEALLADFEPGDGAPPVPSRSWDTWRSKMLRQLGRRVAAVLREALGQRFAEAGPGWTPLKNPTIASKLARGLPPTNKRGNVFRRLQQQGADGADAILIASGRLRDSYRQKNAADHIERIRVTPDGVLVEIGSASSYAPYHQIGVNTVVPSRRRAETVIKLAKSKRARAWTSATTYAGVRRILLPARPVRLTEGDMARVQEVVTAFIEEVAALLDEQ